MGLLFSLPRICLASYYELGFTISVIWDCSVQVLSKSFDTGVGGRDLDARLFMRFAEEFKNKYNIDAVTRPKQMLRLMAEIEKVKKVMSTVTNPQTLSIECFADDKDVTGRTSR